MKLNNLRGFLFWTVDLLRGGKIAKHVEEIKDLLANPMTEKNIRERKHKIEGLIKHATESCPYYNKLAYVDSIDDFPVIDKSIIRADPDSYLSNRYRRTDLVSVVTSGSTGTPFQVFHDVNKRNRNSADTIVFAGRSGFQVGDELVYLKVWSASNQKSTLKAWLQNIIAFDVFRMDDEEMIRLISVLEKKGRKGVLGYASALEQLCKFLEQNPDKIPNKTEVVSALSMSETLSDYTKENFRKYFKIELFARYSNLENGILAQQFEGNANSYQINTASYFVEILKIGEDSPAEAGEMGRIVITDLYNFGMPMIRYDTGDIGKFRVTENGEVDDTVLEHIEGRKLDLLFNTKRELISSYIMYKNMWKYTEIFQYQLIQYGEKDYLFKINAANGFQREAELKNEFVSYLGKDANFQIEYVSEIPLLSSGKRKKVVNTYYKE